MNPSAPSTPPRPEHLGTTTAVICCVSLLLPLILSLAGILPRLESAIDARLSTSIPGPPPSALPSWTPWLAACLLTPGITVATLLSPGLLRKLVLLATTLFLILAWEPVLTLASLSTHVSPPLISTLWAGICSITLSLRESLDHPAP